MRKSTIEEIRKRFDADVDRFSNLDTGQQTTIDAKLSLDLIGQAANALQPKARHLLDIGAGAGNYSLRLLSLNPRLHCTLIDLSEPMLQRASERISAVPNGGITTIQGDAREIHLPNLFFDIVVAGAVFHHLRNNLEWELVFSKIYNALVPGGCLWISDLISHEIPNVQQFMWERFGKYLDSIGGLEYRNRVFDYIGKEDSPKPLTYQLALLSKVGFSSVEVLHKNSVFATFGAVK